MELLEDLEIRNISSPGRLDYIQGMGFDCIWITPPIDSNSFMGYAPWDAVDPGFRLPAKGLKERTYSLLGMSKPMGEP